MRKKKDTETIKIEELKIKDLEQQIREKEEQHQIYIEKSERIEHKKNSMKKFETFLDKVKDENSDEFDEI